MSTQLPTVKNAVPSKSEPSVRRFRIPIATKFLVLIATMIIVSLSSVIFNATRIFQADNLDTVSLSSDLLTAAKSGQVRAWVDATMSRALNIVDLVGTKRKPPPESEILFARVTGPGGIEPVHSWYNAELLKHLGIDANADMPTELRKAIQGSAKPIVTFKPWRHPSGRPVLLIIKPLSEQRIATIAVNSANLAKMFSSSGPYTFMLLNPQGDVLAHKEADHVGRREKIDEIPVIKRVTSSDMDRALQEFPYEGTPTLGTYAKIGVGGLGILNLVSRSTALETGDTLVRRSVMIGVLIFLLSFVASHLFTETIVSPVLKLRAAAQSISSGNYSERVIVKTRDEISDLAAGFNRMCDEISRRIETLARINQIALKVRTLKEPQQILDLAVETFSVLFGFTSAVGVYREKGDGLQGNTFTSTRHWKDGRALKMMSGLLSHTKTPTWVEIGESGALLCPILHQQEARGFVVLASRKDQHKLTDEETALAQTVLSIFTAEFENAGFSRELQAINADLELRVEQRTAELSTANEHLTVAKKEVDDVMNNIQQGIITFGQDGVINHEHSKFALDIFVNQQLAGADIIGLLVKPVPGETREADLRDWLQTIFMQPDQWDMLQDFAIKDLEYEYTDSEENPCRKDLRFEWRPIFGDDGMITKMMLVCVDVTEQKRLAAEISKKEAEHTEQLEIIAQLVNHPKNLVEQFISDFSRNLESALGVIKRGVEALDPDSMVDLMRSLHTIKGCAKQFRLNSVQSRAGALETLVSKAIEQPPEADEMLVFFSKVASEFDILEKSLNQMLELYEKVVNGGKKAGGAGAGLSVPVPMERIEKLLGKVFAGNGAVPAPQARKAVGWLLRSPVASLFDRLTDLANSLAPELQREVQVVRKGDEVGVDFRVLNLLHDGLLHVVRNSLDHGGETPEEREARGRPGKMTISMKAEMLEGERVRIVVQDDGKGISASAVRKRAIERGLVDEAEAEAMPNEQVIQFVFLSGFSTKDEVTEVSGRGVGMEVVKNIVEKELHGTLALTSVEGKGTRLEVIFASDVLIAQLGKAVAKPKPQAAAA